MTSSATLVRTKLGNRERSMRTLRIFLRAAIAADYPRCGDVLKYGERRDADE